MSVRAYLVNEEVKMINGKRYVHEDLEYLWNNWHDSEIFDVLYPYINDMTNEDCVGEIEIIGDVWDMFKEDYKTNEKIHKVVEKHKEVFQKIDSELQYEDDYIRIKMY